MLNAEIVAKYFLAKDPNRILFNNNVVLKNNHKFYEGNARLNKYLFLAQVVYLAKYETKLISDNFVAYANGPVIESIILSYPLMVSQKETVKIPSQIKIFLDKIYDSLKNATYEELIVA